MTFQYENAIKFMTFQNKKDENEDLPCRLPRFAVKLRHYTEVMETYSSHQEFP